MSVERGDRDAALEILAAWGSTIRQYRQWKQLSRRELAARAGISPVFLGEIERGQKDSSSHSLTLIASALEVPLGELFLRVAMKLDTVGRSESDAPPALPLGVREASTDYLQSVPMAQDETAFELYKITRTLRSDQQIAILVLARSMRITE